MCILSTDACIRRCGKGGKCFQLGTGLAIAQADVQSGLRLEQCVLFSREGDARDLTSKSCLAVRILTHNTLCLEFLSVSPCFDLSQIEYFLLHQTCELVSERLITAFNNIVAESILLTPMWYRVLTKLQC